MCLGERFLSHNPLPRLSRTAYKAVSDCVKHITHTGQKENKVLAQPETVFTAQTL